METNLFLEDSLALDNVARAIKAMANDLQPTADGAQSIPEQIETDIGRGEWARWVAIARTELQRAGMWVGKLKLVAKVDPYPYPESTNPSTGEAIAAPIHQFELPEYITGQDAGGYDVVMRLPGGSKVPWLGELTAVTKIKAFRDVIGDMIGQFTKASGGEWPAASIDNALYNQYLGHQVILLEESRHALGMVLGSIYKHRKTEKA